MNKIIKLQVTKCFKEHQTALKRLVILKELSIDKTEELLIEAFIKKTKTLTHKSNSMHTTVQLK